MVELLRAAAGDGRLDLAELDERLEKALTARAKSELETLIADLTEPNRPGVLGPEAKELVRIDCVGGKGGRAGRWVVPRRMEIHVASGAVKLDFTRAVITEPLVQIDARVTGGSLVLVTEPDVEVNVDGVTVLAGKVKARSRTGPRQPVALTVEVSGLVAAGKIVARVSRHRFWRRLRRSQP